jgi:hypothetical protein
MTAFGTKRTSSDVRLEPAMRSKADMGQSICYISGDAKSLFLSVGLCATLEFSNRLAATYACGRTDICRSTDGHSWLRTAHIAEIDHRVEITATVCCSFTSLRACANNSPSKRMRLWCQSEDKRRCRRMTYSSHKQRGQWPTRRGLHHLARWVIRPPKCARRQRSFGWMRNPSEYRIFHRSRCRPEPWLPRQYIALRSRKNACR